MKFSERIGVSQPQVLQINNMSQGLRVALWNIIQELVFISTDHKWMDRFQLVYREYFRWPTDEVPYNYSMALKTIKDWHFKDAAWFEIYNFIEYLILNSSRFFLGDRLKKLLPFSVNAVLEEENSGFRAVSGILTPITNNLELDEVTSASSETNNEKINVIHTHIKSAVELISKKPNPDYRNSIKESISAVEAAVKIITNVSGGGVKDALNVLEKEMPIHGSMKDGIIKLYGWTSNADGIRHGLLEESTVGFDEAKYMLVMCSAFVNYLIVKANPLGKFAS